MKLLEPISLRAAAEMLQIRFSGDPDHLIYGMNEIHRVEKGDLSFVDVEKYSAKALNSAATTILINKDIDPPAGKGLLISDDPFRDFNRFGQHFQPRQPLDAGDATRNWPNGKIGLNVVIGDAITMGVNIEIGHNCVIGNNVSIGADTLIYPNVTIYDHTVIGDGVVIHSGTVIGSDAYYFKKRPGSWDKLMSTGRVVIEDYVEIGSNCTIDRGVSADTVIGAHSKLDNLVQIGHDTVIGKRCLLASQVGVAGVCNIGDDVKLWGQVGVTPDSNIGSGAELMGKTGVMSHLEGNKVYGGMVADDARAFLKKEAIMKRLIEIMPQLEKMLLD